ncbi:MAG TPA: glycosyltransferase family 39 protein [bacterium]|nr:glycosyltransferase family 39 protein [bacterium]
MSAGRRAAVAFALCLLLVGVLFVSRLALILASPHVYDDEEIKTGSIAYAVTHERALPLWDYQPGDYEGGTFLYGLLAVPFMKLFGETRLALKMLALLTVMLTTLAAVAYARRYAGWPGAAAVAALFVFPAPYLVQIGLIPWGNYAENVMLTMLAFFVEAKILTAENTRIWAWPLWGALCGLGVYVHYGFLVTVVYLLFLWLLTRPKLLFSVRGASWFGGFVVGFAPWLAYNAAHQWRGLMRFGQGLAMPLDFEERLALFVRNFFHLWMIDVPVGLHFSFLSPSFVRLLSYAYYLLLLGLIAALIVLRRQDARRIVSSFWPWDERPKPDASFWLLAPLGYVMLYAIVFSFSDYGLFAPNWGVKDPESHAHIFAVYPLLTLTAGLAVGVAWSTSWRRVTVAAAGALALLGAAGMIALADNPAEARERMGAPAYSIMGLYAEMGFKYSNNKDDLLRVSDRISEANRYHLLFGAGAHQGAGAVNDPQAAVAEGFKQPARLQPAFWMGAGAAYYAALTIPMENKNQALAKIEEPAASWFSFGACLGSLWVGLDHPACLDIDERAAGLLLLAGDRPELRTLIQSRLTEIHQLIN